jgi:UPF0755 protein
VRLFQVTIVVALGLMGAGAAALLVAERYYRAPGPLGMSSALVVPRGGVSTTAATLANAGVISSQLAFKCAIIATASQGALRAAEFAFPAHASLANVIEILRFARPVQHRLTIAEGLTAAQIATLLAQTDGLTGDTPVPAEGAVLPDTYQYERGATRRTILARAEEAMTRTLIEAWSGRSSGSPLSSTREALILSSIVEREAKLPAERAMIARVFLNRLAHGMRLQADPTTAYGASGGTGALDRALTHDDLARTDAYNTYVVPGLPAGPICSPGPASILATLHPAAGDALYFVADGSGGHVFAATLAGHNANVARWREQRP